MRTGGFADLESLLVDVQHADAIFVGEEHDDPDTHRIELMLLEGLVRRKARVVLALEMFERDVQPALDRYLAGATSEDEDAFLGAARPWPRYASDYRPLVEFARAHHVPVVASNVPRRIASAVAKNGLGALDGLGADRALAAADIQCLQAGAYYDRFVEAMGEHPGSSRSVATETRNANFYLSQCVKDETMGESVAHALQEHPGATVLHVNGSFHSDYGEGTPASARRRLPAARFAIVTIVPVSNLDAAHPDEDDRARADYLVFTATSRK
jgi:uncharacterized iron-regulated protein